MDQDSAKQWWAVISASPWLTLLSVAFLIGVIWKLVDWAYKLRIEGLKEQISAREAQRDLASDRLLVSNQELERVKAELEKAKGTRESYFEPAMLGIARVISANQAVATSTSSSIVKSTYTPGQPQLREVKELGITTREPRQR